MIELFVMIVIIYPKNVFIGILTVKILETRKLMVILIY